MDVFMQTTGAVLVAVIVLLVLGRQEKSLASMLAICVCAMVLTVAVGFLKPVLDFLEELEQLGTLHGEMVQILLKVAGISILTETACLICTDSGNASLGQALRIVSSCLILWLSIPVFSAVLDLIRTILEGV